MKDLLTTKVKKEFRESGDNDMEIEEGIRSKTTMERGTADWQRRWMGSPAFLPEYTSNKERDHELC